MKERRGITINVYEAAMEKGRLERRFPMIKSVRFWNSHLVGLVGGKPLAYFQTGLDQFVSEIIR